jgi:hypothetical protein
MALYGSARDVLFMKSISRELLEDVVSQQIGYYKIVLGSTKPNVYGESLNKSYIGPVLINCLIERGDFAATKNEQLVDTTRAVSFRFLRDHLVDANVVPEVGDIIMYNESYYQVDNVNENQLVLGKDNNYAYSEGLEKFGSSFSIICVTHYTSPDALGIAKERL